MRISAGILKVSLQSVAPILCGAFASTQVQLNGLLTNATGSFLTTALISLSVGLGTLTIVLAARRQIRSKDQAKLVRPPRGRLRAWWFGTGCLGAFIVATYSAAGPSIGVTLQAISFAGGLLAGSLIADHFHLAPGGPRPVTSKRVAAALVALGGVWLASQGGESHFAAVIVTIVVASGFAEAFLLAGQGHLTQRYGSPIVAAWLLYAVSTGAMLLIVGSLVAAGKLHPVVGDVPPWVYAGGLLGAIVTVIFSALVSWRGVLRFTLAFITGQLLGALLLDALTPLANVPVTTLRLLAVVVVVAASVVGADVSRPPIDADQAASGT